MKEARKYCQEVYDMVLEYKDANARVTSSCKLITETLLVSIVKKKVGPGRCCPPPVQWHPMTWRAIYAGGDHGSGSNPRFLR